MIFLNNDNTHYRWRHCLLAAVLVLFNASCDVHGAPLSALSGAGHDGKIRLLDDCLPEVDSTGSKASTATSVAAFYDPSLAADAKSGWTDTMLEEAAQALESRGVKFLKVNVKKCHQTSPDAKPGSVVVYRNRKYEYRGLRSSQALVSFILKVSMEPVNIIVSKSHKKAFEKLEGPRLAALLEPGTKGAVEFAQAAAALHPYIACYIVPDRKIVFDAKDPGGALKSLKSKPQGTVAYYAPYEEKPEFLPEGSADEILRFFSEGQPSFLRRLYPHELYATMEVCSSSERLVLALLLPRSVEGLVLYKTLKRLANSDGIRDVKVNVLYVNMEDFPMHIGALEQEFGVDLEKPAMGLINTTSGDAVWFTKPDLPLLDKDDQEIAVHDWLRQVTNDKPKEEVTDVEPDSETMKEDKSTNTETKGSDDKVANAVQEDGDFKPRDDTDDDDDDDDEDGKDVEGLNVQEEEATTPDDDKDEDEKNDEDDKPVIGHNGADHKNSKYMQQFMDGEKVFSKIFSAVVSPVKSVFSSSNGDVGSPEQAQPAAAKGTNPKPPKQVKQMEARGKQKKQETPAPAIHQKPTVGGKDPYIDKDAKLFTNIAKFVLRMIGIGSGSDASDDYDNDDEDKPVISKATKASIPASPKPHQIIDSKTYKSNPEDKILTNLFKGIYRIVTLPIECVFGSSDSSPSPQASKLADEQPVKVVDSKDFKSSEDDKFISNLVKLVLSPFTSVIDSLKGDQVPGKEAPAAKPFEMKQTPPPPATEKPRQAAKIHAEKTKPAKEEVPKKKNRDPREPVAVNPDWKMPEKGSQDDKIIASIFKSAVNLVTGGSGNSDHVTTAEENAKPEKNNKHKKSAATKTKPKTEHKKEAVVPEIKKAPAKKAKKLEKVEKKQEAPAVQTHTATGERVVVPGEDGHDMYMSNDDKLIPNIVKLAKSIVGGGADNTDESKPEPVQQKVRPVKAGPKKAEAEEKPVRESKTKKLKSKRMQPPEGKLSDEKPLPAIKPMPEFGSDSDKIITTIVKTIFGSVQNVVSADTNVPAKPAEEAKPAPPKIKAAKPAEPKSTKPVKEPVKEHVKSKQPKKSYKPVPVPDLKAKEPQDKKQEKDLAYMNKFSSNPEDKLLSYTFKLIVNTVKDFIIGKKSVPGKDEDGDALKKIVMPNLKVEAEAIVSGADRFPKAEVLNSVFNDESYGQEEEEAQISRDEETDKLTHAEFLKEAFKDEPIEDEIVDEKDLPEDKADGSIMENGPEPIIERPINIIESNNDINDDDDDDDNDEDKEVKKQEEKIEMMSNEDFITMAFDEEASKKEEFFVDGDDDEIVDDDDDDDNDNDENAMNYVPFHGDPRKQFQHNLQDVKKESDEPLYEHGNIHDRKLQQL